MSEFKRENRYLVLKLTDIFDALDISDAQILFDLAEQVCDFRSQQNKNNLNCVVVEDDWPEYERVWNMLEERWSSKNT